MGDVRIVHRPDLDRGSFSVRVGHPWAGPASIPGATHYEQTPVQFQPSNSV